MKIGWLIIAFVALFLAVDKVRNEHAMTVAYDRQATALETIAHVLERNNVTWDD